MPFSPLFIPALIYPICQKQAWRQHRQQALASIHPGSAETTVAGQSRRRSEGVLAKLWLGAANAWSTRFSAKPFSAKEIVWITSMVAAGGGLAPAYQWIATIDTDYGQPLGHWQQFGVVLATQLFGWSLGYVLRRAFVGRENGMAWPDVLPLSFLIQTLFPNKTSQNTETIACKAKATVQECCSADERADLSEGSLETSGRFEDEPVYVSAARKRCVVLVTLAVFVYQVLLDCIAPIFKSLSLLCIWAPQSRILSTLGSGWSGAGILSLTFDWEALGTFQPLVTPMWAQVHFYCGAFLMMYILTPAGWRSNWWESRGLPIVSTNVFDSTGNVYNISTVHTVGSSATVYHAYSPVRLAVNSALGYICSVAAIAASALHLVIWHPQWLHHAVSEVACSLLRLWDPCLLFWASRSSTEVRALDGGSGSSERTSARTSSRLAKWPVVLIAGRVGRLLIFIAPLGFSVMSAQLGISALPGWQSLLAVVWAVLMCFPIGFVEAVAGFTLPMDILPHIISGWLQGPGSPLETSYFHLWATAPIRVALGWAGVRSFQLAHCCFPSGRCPEADSESEEYVGTQAADCGQRVRQQLPWIKRGLLVGVILGACINHLSYIALSHSQKHASGLPLQYEATPAESVSQSSMLPTTATPAATLIGSIANAMEATPGESSTAPAAAPSSIGWHEESEWARLPAALSSELVVWGIVGPRSLFARHSPYRFLFLYGAAIGISLPLILYLIHKLCARFSTKMPRPSSASGSSSRRRFLGRFIKQLGGIAKAVQVPLVLTGMVAVPTTPANFVITGILVAVGGQSWCRYKGRRLVDRSLYSAAMDTGTRMAVAMLFIIGQVLSVHRLSLSFVNWWGNQTGNIEHCMPT